MNTAYVVCEGPADAAVLAEILRPWSTPRGVRVTAGQGRSAAVSMARTLAAGSGDPVALVLDSDVADPARADADRTDLRALLRMASGGRPADAFLFVPTLEALFFDVPSALAVALKVPAIQPSVLAVAKYAPKEQLDGLLEHAGWGRGTASLVRLARTLGLAQLSGNRTLGELTTFIRQAVPRLHKPRLHKPSVA